MEKESTDLSLVDLYEDNCEVLTFLETSLKILHEESEKWNSVLHSHMDKVLQSTKFLKIETLGAGLDWLNTAKPLTLDKDLKDRVIVLDFFTYCCINCEHALPYLQELEVKFDKNPELLIIGVHSPKFPNEKSLDSVKNAVLRNKITHPVINDPENSLWNKLGVYCWPTVLILSPDHRVLFSLVGEMQIEKLSYLCNEMINYFKIHNTTLNKNQLCLNIPDDYSSIDSLLYPSGISIEEYSMMVSDTGHNRLLLLSIDGEVLDVIGNGKSGCNDGSFANSSFDRPHGTTWWNANIVFVADTGNHAIRMIDLKAKSVSTIFNARVLDTECYDIVVQGFASPWDVCVGPELGSDIVMCNVLYIAVAGSHQIWAMNLEHSILESKQYSSLKCTPFAGNGKEECRNNTYKMKAGFAQPSGIEYSEYLRTLFIADSESSTVRSISLVDGSVKTIVGGGLDPKDLFKYGDKDGCGYDVKLQHPIGICVMKKGIISITDTYNHKIKLITVPFQKCSTVAGSGIRGIKCKTSALESEFDEPNGICYSSFKKGFFVVDSNNHSIKFFDPKKKVVEFFPLKFTNSCCIDGAMNSNLEVSLHSEDSKHTIFCQNTKCIKMNLAYGGKICCTFKLNGVGISLTNEAKQPPFELNLVGKSRWTIDIVSGNLFDPSKQPVLILQNRDKDEEARNFQATITDHLYLCDNVNNVCFPKKFVMKLDVELSNSGANSFDVIFLF